MTTVLNRRRKNMSIYDIEVVNIDEEVESMNLYKGKVLLIVNTASK
jgi:glutathione peroxidase-family protein